MTEEDMSEGEEKEKSPPGYQCLYRKAAVSMIFALSLPALGVQTPSAVCNEN